MYMKTVDVLTYTALCAVSLRLRSVNCLAAIFIALKATVWFAVRSRAYTDLTSVHDRDPPTTMDADCRRFGQDTQTPVWETAAMVLHKMLNTS